MKLSQSSGENKTRINATSNRPHFKLKNCSFPWMNVKMEGKGRCISAGKAIYECPDKPLNSPDWLTRHRRLGWRPVLLGRYFWLVYLQQFPARPPDAAALRSVPWQAVLLEIVKEGKFSILEENFRKLKKKSHKSIVAAWILWMSCQS